MDRYKRHLLLPEVGGQGQQALLASSVLVVGAGGLGCPILSALVGAGVGRVGLCDGDKVEASNLHRQTLYRTADIGRAKVDAAAEALSGLNPDVLIEPHERALDASNAAGLVSRYDLIVEGLDRYAPRYLVNAACLAAAKPLVSAAASRFSGQVAVLAPGRASLPCYACLVPDAPDDELACETEGVMGPVTGIVGNQAALLALRLLAGDDTALGTLTISDLAAGATRRIALPRDPSCRVCGPDGEAPV